MILVFLPLFASLAGWMISGSPVPMGISMLLTLSAVACRLIARRPLGFWPAVLLSLFASVIQIWVFREGLAFDSAVPLPAPFHAAMGMLWFSSARAITAGAAPSPRRLWISLAGSLAVLGVAASSTLIQYGPWQVYPVASLPLMGSFLAAFPTGRKLQAGKIFAGLAGALTISLLILGIRSSAAAVQLWVSGEVDAPAPYNMEGDSSEATDSGTQQSASRRVPRNADISFEGKTRVYLHTADSRLFKQWIEKPIYLRTQTLSIFENDEYISPIPTVQWIYDSDDGNEDQAVDLVPDIHTPLTNYTVYIGAEHATQLPLLEHSERLHCNAVYEFADDWYQLAPREEIHRLKYKVSLPVRSTPRLPESQEDFRRLNAPNLYLNLPPSPLAARMAGLSRRFDTDTPLQEIQAFMRGKMRYSLKFETPEDSNPIEEFVFRKQPGHCEHFATATVMILRSLGIPSRIAYGYSGGVADSAQQVMAFRDSDFHAWAEILTPENDWIVFDTTPYVANASPRVALQKSITTLTTGSYYDYSGLSVETEFYQLGLVDRFLDLVAFISQHIFAVSMISFLLIGGLWFLFFRASGKRSRALGSSQYLSTDEIPQFAFLHEIETAAKEHGVIKKPGTTWIELLSSIRPRLSVEPVVEEAILYTYSVAYAGRRREKTKEQHFQEALHLWRESLRRN